MGARRWMALRQIKPDQNRNGASNGPLLLISRKMPKRHSHKMKPSSCVGVSTMKKLAIPIVNIMYRAYLRSRLMRCTRDLQMIAAQRENDFHAERILHREVVKVRSKLHSL
jgi:hypothetical protein